MKKIILLIAIIAFTSAGLIAQESPTYKLEHVHSVVNANNSKAYVILKVTPFNAEEFKMIISMRVAYCFGENCVPNTILIEEQRQTKNKTFINITSYGANISEKSELLYDVIKDKVDITPDSKFLVFTFYNLKEKDVRHMNFTYGLWEYNNMDVRHEKTFSIELERLLSEQ